jgi:hypothetical protein
MDHLTSTFTLFDLPWRNGDYHRTTFNVTASWKKEIPSLSSKSSYCVKAQHLADVKFEHCVYIANESSRVQSHVFAPSKVDLNQTPLAFARVGYGYLGYIGDVNTETMTTLIIIDLVNWKLKNPSKVKKRMKESRKKEDRMNE